MPFPSLHNDSFVLWSLQSVISVGVLGMYHVVGLLGPAAQNLTADIMGDGDVECDATLSATLRNVRLGSNC